MCILFIDFFWLELGNLVNSNKDFVYRIKNLWLGEKKQLFDKGGLRNCDHTIRPLFEVFLIPQTNFSLSVFCRFFVIY